MYWGWRQGDAPAPVASGLSSGEGGRPAKASIRPAADAVAQADPCTRTKLASRPRRPPLRQRDIAGMYTRSPLRASPGRRARGARHLAAGRKRQRDTWCPCRPRSPRGSMGPRGSSSSAAASAVSIPRCALERLAANGAPVQVSLVNRENYLVFQPMLAEVVAGDVGILDTVSPLRQLLPRTDLFVREIEGVDLERRVVTLGAGLPPRVQELPFDHLVIALGDVTDFRGVPGLPEHALPFKTLADAVRIRNHVIHVLEQASVGARRRAAAHDAHVRGRRRRLLGHRGGGRAERLRARRRRRTTGRSRRRRCGSSSCTAASSCSSASSRRGSRRYATTALAAQGIELLLGERLVAASPQSAVLVRRPADLDAHADLDRPVLAQPGRRGARAPPGSGAPAVRCDARGQGAQTVSGRSGTAG